MKMFTLEECSAVTLMGHFLLLVYYTPTCTSYSSTWLLQLVIILEQVEKNF